MDRINSSSRTSFSSDNNDSDSELSPLTESRPPQDWNLPNHRTGTIPGGQFELPLATPLSTTTASTSPFLLSPNSRERAVSASDAIFESSRKRASSEADKSKPAKESGRRTLFSRPSKIMTSLAGGGNKDKDKIKEVEHEDSPISPGYFRPFAQPLRPRHSHDETHRNFSLNSNLSSLTLQSTGASPVDAPTSHPSVLSTSNTGSTTSSLRPQLFHRSRKDSNPTSVLSVSTALSKQNSSESNLSHSPASPSVIFAMERTASGIPKSVSNQDIRQVSAGHYSDAASVDDPWPLLRARALGLFHGEGIRVHIEELNRLVLSYIRRCIQERQADLIEEDIQDLLETGMRNTDPSLQSLSNEKLIDRLIEMWWSFFSTTLPYFEAVFLPLKQYPELGIDIRRQVLIAYRDYVILPLYPRLEAIFSVVQPEMPTKQSIQDTAARVLQCLSVLASVLTGDENQKRMDDLLKMLKGTWIRRRIGGDRRGYVVGKSIPSAIALATVPASPL